MFISGDRYSAAKIAGYGALSVCDEIVLFGVRVKVDPMRKCVSMNNLTDYESSSGSTESNNLCEKSGDDLPKAPAPGGGAAGYVSADDGVLYPATGSKREEEHKLFLIGLHKVGKRDWRGISKNYVKTRTPTQVASHAQKYFIRHNNLKRRRRRTSVFDMTPDSIVMTEEVGESQGNPPRPVPPQPIVSPPIPSNANDFSAAPVSTPASHVQPSMQHENVDNPMPPVSLTLSLSSLGQDQKRFNNTIKVA
ncbi:transcription factor MYB1R1-like isoform X2 [Andrographis paniculata]|uniref:transcription factor MYB1R1-like isoform X2 n=1 Tax=Andrographis paniculata TaxID=175694 RepID=UPI0021E70D49|nr:transcription factor MYB1R1-like isoform X2 [Andrographis paniculata]